MIKLSSLNSDDEFKKLLKLRKIHNNSFTIYFGKIYTNKKNKDFKISIVAKKKIGNAVKRNIIKRKLRSAVQKSLNKTILKKKKYGFLIIAKTKAYGEKFSVLSTQVYKTFEKIEKIIN